MSQSDEGQLHHILSKVKAGDVDVNCNLECGRTPLFLAVEQKKACVVADLISLGAYVNCRAKGVTALMIACKSKDQNIVKLLIESNAYLNEADELWNTPLDFALNIAVRDDDLEINADRHEAHYQNQSSEIARYLIQSKASMEQYARGWTPLHDSVCLGDLDTVKYWANNMALLNSCDQFHGTSLNLAASLGYFNIVKCLVENKANVNKIYQYGGYPNTPAKNASDRAHHEVVQQLIENKAYLSQVHDSNETQLIDAAAIGDLDLVRKLVESMVDLHKPSQYDGTHCIHAAAKSGDLDVVKYLIENKASTDSRDFYDRAPLHTAVEEGNLEVVKWLIENKADVNSIGCVGKTPFLQAVEYGHLETVKCLAENKASIEMSDENGRNPTNIAASIRTDGILQYLVDIKADVSKPDDLGHTPISSAVFCGHACHVKCLVENNADVNQEDVNGLPVISNAISLNNLEIVKYLVEKKADINRIDRNGYTPMIAALQCCKLDILKCLIETGDANVQKSHVQDMTPLHVAISCNMSVRAGCDDYDEYDDDDDDDDEYYDDQDEYYDEDHNDENCAKVVECLLNAALQEASSNSESQPNKK